MMRMHNNTPRLADALAEKCAAGRSLYRSNLLGTIDLFRVQAALGLLAWPSKSATPTQVTRSEGGARIFRHGGSPAPTVERSRELAVCSLVSRPYVLDLLPGRSVVQALQRAGREVGLLDWARSRRFRMRSASITTRSGSSCARFYASAHRLHAAPPGHCMGGMPLLLAFVGDAQVRSLVAMATPVELQHDLCSRHGLARLLPRHGAVTRVFRGLHRPGTRTANRPPSEERPDAGTDHRRRPHLSLRDIEAPIFSRYAEADHIRPRPRTRCIRCSRWDVGTWSRRRARRRAERAREPWRRARKQEGPTSHVAGSTAYRAKRLPEGPAVVEPHTSLRFTHRELDGLGNRAAHMLVVRPSPPPVFRRLAASRYEHMKTSKTP